MENFSWSGRWALVTGASSGIGTAFAWSLARRGANLILVARRKERLAALADEIRAKYGVEAEVHPTDLAARGQASALWDQLSVDREIHLVVNNAGFGLQGPFDELPLERQVEMVRLNDEALLVLTHKAIAKMASRGSGGVINVASVVGFLPVPLFATYAASKAFVLSLSEALAAEYRGKGVRICALCPGSTPTEFQEVAGSKLPRGGLGLLSPEVVVERCLAGFEAGEEVIVPGVANRITAAAPRAIPRGLMARIAGFFSERLR